MRVNLCGPRKGGILQVRSHAIGTVARAPPPRPPRIYTDTSVALPVLAQRMRDVVAGGRGERLPGRPADSFQRPPVAVQSADGGRPRWTGDGARWEDGLSECACSEAVRHLSSPTADAPWSAASASGSITKEASLMSTTTTTPVDETTPAAEPTNAQQSARKGRRWPWIVALVVVAALGAIGTGIGAASAASAQSELSTVRAELAVVQDDYADLETREGIAQSSLELIRDHRDRLELQLEELQETQG